MSISSIKKETLVHFLKELRETFIASFERLENKRIFEKKAWKYSQKGGGEIALLRGGQHFEKAAVNISVIEGDSFPLDASQGTFFAAGVSLITHMQNPHAPTAHFNIRFFQTEQGHWFGGGYDLTPMGFPYKEDTEHFHNIAKVALSPFGKDFYLIFSKNAREYFYIPHYAEERGVGGIFFDHWNTGNFEKDSAMWQTVGLSFLEAILPIYERRLTHPYTLEDKEIQLYRRARYAEFILTYDRGTKFGFQSGGNPEAILCSMPPLAKW